MRRRVFISDPTYAVQYAFRTERGILYFLQTNRFRYRRGERVVITFVKINVSNRPIRLTYPTAQRFDIWVTRGNTEVWRWSEGRFFTQAVESVVLQPGQAQTFSAVWNQRTRAGRLVPTGTYRVNAWNVATRVPVSVRIVIGQTGVTTTTPGGAQILQEGMSGQEILDLEEE